MAAAIALTPSTAIELYNSVSIAVTGATASTDYIIQVDGASGRVYYIEATTNGSGAVTVTFIPQTRGTFNVSLRPKAEYKGTTTAAATASGSAV